LSASWRTTTLAVAQPLRRPGAPGFTELGQRKRRHQPKREQCARWLGQRRATAGIIAQAEQSIAGATVHFSKNL